MTATTPEPVTVDVTTGTAPVTVDVTAAAPVPVTVAATVATVQVAPSGVPGPPGPGGADGVDGAAGITVTAGANLGQAQAAWVDPTGYAYPASSTDAATAGKVAGLARHAALTGETTVLVAAGEVQAVGLPVGPVFLDPAGYPTADPDTGVVQLRVGTAVDPGRLVVRIEPGIHHI